MLKFYRLSVFLLLSFFIFSTVSAQEFNGDWTCAYATNDDDVNGTGIQTITMTVISENEFVAMVSKAWKPWAEDDACYLVGYRDADSSNGRLETIDYNTAFNMQWISGFDQVFMAHARDLASRGNLIFVPNNDVGSNILVFELAEEGVVSHPMRMSTNTNPFETRPIWAIDIDDAGRVYVTTEGDSTTASEILIYESPDVESAWSSGHDAEPIATIVLPDNGDARGITVNKEGTAIYVSNYVSEKIYCFTGDTENGYALAEGFEFTLTDTLTSTGGEFLDPGPWGLQLMNDKNILAVACHSDFVRGENYQYGRVYFLNPNTGAILDTLDIAKWNLDQTGDWSTRGGGTASGYTSPYNVDFDASGNVYTQSYFGWTVDKWVFSGELPTIDLTITGIEQDFTRIPSEFSLGQNYPNPFNPSTTIEFSIMEESEITLSVYSLTGELVTDLIKSSNYNSGVYKVSFDASSLSSGMYIYKLDNGIQTISKKMTLIK